MFEGMSEPETLVTARHLFEETRDVWTRWFEKIKRDYRYHSGGEDQWDAADLAVLQKQKRPALSFNLMGVVIRELIGAQEDAKREARAVPIGIEDQTRSEILNRLWKAVRRMTDADFTESEAFEKGSIGGVAYAVVDVNPRHGRPDWVDFCIDPIHPFEVLVDPGAQRRDLRDAQFIFWNRWLRDSEFVRAYPKEKEWVEKLWAGTNEAIGPNEVRENSTDLVPQPTSPIDLVGFEADPLYLDRRRRRIRLLHLEYRCPREVYYVFNPQTGTPERVSEKNYRVFRNLMPELEFARVFEDQVYWLEFIGDKVLFHEPAPARARSFSIKTYVCDRDHSTGEPRGLIRDLVDPQREVNKRHSQMLHHLNQQGAPGLYAEQDAFVDPAQAENSMKEAGGITWMAKGALTQNKIEKREPPSFPAASAEMLQQALQMFFRIGGVNIDTLVGQRSGEEPATTALLRYRRSILAVTKHLQNFHSFQRRILESVLDLLTHVVPDAQIEAMLGNPEKWRVQDGVVVDQQTGEEISLQGLSDMEWDIEMDVSAANTTIALLTLQIMLQMAAVGVPIDGTVMIDELPISQDKKNRMQAYIEGTRQAASQQAEVEQGELQKRLNLDAAIAQVEAQLKVANTAEDGRHNLALEQLQDLRSQRDFVTKLLNLAQDSKTKNVGQMFQLLGRIVDLAGKVPAAERRIAEQRAKDPNAPTLPTFDPPPTPPVPQLIVPQDQQFGAPGAL